MEWPKRFPRIPITIDRYHLWEWWPVKMVLLGLLGWLVWSHIVPQTPEASPTLKKAINEQVSYALGDLARNAAAMKIGRIAVLHLERDDTNYGTETLRTELFGKGVGTQPDRTTLEKVRGLLGLDEPEYGDAGKAVARGRSLGVDAVVFGSLRQAGAEVTLDLKLAEVNTRHTTAIATLPPPPAAPPTGPWGSPKVAVMNGAAVLGHVDGGGPASLLVIRQLLIAGAIALLMPVFSINVLRSVVRRQSSISNLFTLCIYTMADVLILVALLLHYVGPGWSALAAAIGAFAAFFYNISVMSWVLQQEGLA